MVRGTISRKVTFLTLVLCCLCLSEVEGRRRYQPTPADPSRGKLILRDDYGIASVYEQDCPKTLTDKPKIIFPNSTFSYSSYFSLSCTAPYPVTITFEGNKPWTVEAQLVLASATPQNRTKPCYTVNIRKYVGGSDLSPIGTYTCQSVSDPSKATSQYIFIQEGWSWNLRGSFNIPSNPKVYIDRSQVTKLHIPCPAMKPLMTETNTELRKEINGTGIQKPASKGRGWKVTFDPLKGFLVTLPPPSEKNENSSTVEGLYICTSTLNYQYQITEIEVEHRPFIVFPNQTNLTFSSYSEGKLTFQCFSSTPVDIKVLNSTVELIEVKGQGQVGNDLYKDSGYIYSASSTFKTNDPKAQGYIGCVDKGSLKAHFVWHFDNNYICRCKWNTTYKDGHYYDHRYRDRYSRDPEFGEDPQQSNIPLSDYEYFDTPYVRGDLTCSNAKAEVVDFIFIPCANPIECSFIERECDKDGCPYIKQEYFYLSDRYYEGGTLNLYANMTTKTFRLTPGIVLCTADGFGTKLRATSDWESNMQFNAKLGTGDKDLLTIRKTEDHVYTGDTMLYQCVGTSSGVFGPVMWAFEFQDGTFNYSSEYQEDNWGYYSDRVRNEVPMRTTFLTIPSKKAKKLWCYAPRYNSTDWAKVSIDLQIEDSQVQEDPPNCPKRAVPFIVMYRNSSVSSQRQRLPHRVDGKDVFVYDPVQSVSLYCMANFPLQWTKDGVNISEVRHSRANCRREDGMIVVGKLFKRTIAFPIGALNATGNYTCRSTTPHQSRQTSVYLYAITPENRTTFVDEGRHHIVQHLYDNYSSKAEESKWAVLPCRLNRPNLTPYLFIDHAEHETIERVNFQKNYLKFDPKIGFSIDTTNKEVIKNRTTVFFCSDNKEGHFIGTLITLELIYEPPKSNNSNVTTTTTTPSSIENPGGTTSGSLDVTSSPTGMTPIVHQDGNAGFIVSIILLAVLCFASFGIIYFLYQKIQLNQRKSGFKAGEELDWTRAQNHVDTNGISGSNGIGNGIGVAPFEGQGQGQNDFDDAPQFENLAQFESLGNLVLDKEGKNLNIQPPTDSLVSLTDNESDFGYKKL